MSSEPTPDHAWLAQRQEDVIEPELPMVDAHHHLWDHTGRYLFDELLADVQSGHNVRASVFVNCWSMYRAEEPEALRPVGEVEFVNGAAAMSASGIYGPPRLCAGIIGYADLRLGSAGDVLEAQIRAGGGRFRGIRAMSAWDQDPTLAPGPSRSTRGLLQDPAFLAGFRHLGRLGLVFEAWALHPQLPEVLDLARAFPGTPMVLNHIGGLLTGGAYASRSEEAYALWRANMAELSGCPNVSVKLGGLGRRTPGVADFSKEAVPPSSERLAGLWKRPIETCIALFGVERCMFESNFPVDKNYYSYRVAWNAYKRITASYSAAEKQALYSGAASRIYNLPET